MADNELRKSWEETARHLIAARGEVTHEFPTILDGGGIDRFDEFLAINELELAFDELEEIGSEWECSQCFWEELLFAAENMKLLEHATRCRNRLEKFS